MKNNIREILDKTNINVLDEINILEYIDELEQIKEDSIDKLDELENKIYKAIEYITHEWFKREQIGISHLSFSYDELQHILDILKGEDNDK